MSSRDHARAMRAWAAQRTRSIAAPLMAGNHRQRKSAPATDANEVTWLASAPKDRRPREPTRAA